MGNSRNAPRTQRLTRRAFYGRKKPTIAMGIGVNRPDAGDAGSTAEGKSTTVEVAVEKVHSESGDDKR